MLTWNSVQGERPSGGVEYPLNLSRNLCSCRRETMLIGGARILRSAPPDTYVARLENG